MPRCAQSRCAARTRSSEHHTAIRPPVRDPLALRADSVTLSLLSALVTVDGDLSVFLPKPSVRESRGSRDGRDSARARETRERDRETCARDKHGPTQQSTQILYPTAVSKEVAKTRVQLVDPTLTESINPRHMFQVPTHLESCQPGSQLQSLVHEARGSRNG